MFLRVLIHLTMHDYPPLISGSLQLLFKHFSQRQEVLHTFKQVTLRGPAAPHAWLWVGDVGWILALSLGGRSGICALNWKPLGMLLQVQLLISAQDVENYKVIKSELDKLRTMVEKSELWVDKKGSTKGDSTGEGNKKEKKEVRALSKTLGSRVGREWEAGGQLTLIQHLMPLDREAPGGSVRCGWRGKV